MYMGGRHEAEQMVIHVMIDHQINETVLMGHIRKYLINTTLPRCWVWAYVSKVIHVMIDYQINDNCCNEPFASM
jgi:hypothetical protein